MVQWGLSGQHVTMDAHMEVVMFGVVLASMEETTKFMRIFTMNITQRFDAWDGLCGVCIR
jgi:hypothetical protein